MIQNNNKLPGLSNKFLNRSLCYSNILCDCNLIELTSGPFLNIKLEREHKIYIICSSAGCCFAIPSPSSFFSSCHVYTWTLQDSSIYTLSQGDLIPSHSFIFQPALTLQHLHLIYNSIWFFWYFALQLLRVLNIVKILGLCLWHRLWAVIY